VTSDDGDALHRAQVAGWSCPRVRRGTTGRPRALQPASSATADGRAGAADPARIQADLLARASSAVYGEGVGSGWAAT
jgi:hypothetical protein